MKEVEIAGMMVMNGLTMMRIGPRAYPFFLTTLLVLSLLIFPMVPSDGPSGEAISDQGSVSNVDGPGRTVGSVTPWPMFLKDAQHTGRVDPESSIRGIDSPSIKWDRELSISSWGSTVGNFTPNISPDSGITKPKMEYIVFVDDGVVYIVDGRYGESAWELQIDTIPGTPAGTSTRTTPAIADFDGNGKLEIVFGTPNGRIHSFEPSISYGSEGYNWSSDNNITDMKWTYPQTGNIGNISSASPLIYDIDQDGNPDVIFGFTGGSDVSLIALDGKLGTWIFDRTLQGALISTPVIYERASIPRIAVLTHESNTLHLYTLRSNGNVAKDVTFPATLTPISLGWGILPSPVVGEFDGDSGNGKEYAFMTPQENNLNGVLRVFHNDDTLYWESTLTIGSADASPTVGDLNGDSTDEIVISTSVLGLTSIETRIYALNTKEKELLWEKSKDTVSIGADEYAVSSPILADMNNDGTLDVIGATTPELYAMDGNGGGFLWNLTIPNRVIWSSPVSSDLDGDGFLDIVLESASISQRIIDLTLYEKEIEFDKDPIVEEQEITISALIHNIGQSDAQDIDVEFYEGDQLIGSYNIDEVSGNDDTREASVQWNPSQEGTVTLTIIVDPNEEIEELNEDNNQVFKQVTVVPAYPDLVIANVSYYRGDGKEADGSNIHLVAGDEATINARVENIGGDEALDFQVGFLEGNTEFAVSENISRLDTGNYYNVSAKWVPSQGDMDLKIKADYYNLNVELDETNNEYSDSVQVLPNDPGRVSYIVSGFVYQPGGINVPASNVNVTVTNTRTNEVGKNTTSLIGGFEFDLQALPNGFWEGDVIEVEASDIEEGLLNQTNITVYSEDGESQVEMILAQIPQYYIELTTDDLGKDVLSGSTVVYNLTVTNKGNAENTIDLTISEPKDVSTKNDAVNWSAILDVTTVVLDEGDSTQVKLSVICPPNSPAYQQVTVDVMATSTDDNEQNDHLTTTTTVLPTTMVDLTLDEVDWEVNPSEESTKVFHLLVYNTGNTRAEVSLSSSPTFTGWSVDFEPSEVDIQPGDSLESNVTITLPTDADAGTYNFTISASTDDGDLLDETDFTVKVLRPDLSISPSDITLSTQQPKLNQIVFITAVIWNYGNVGVDDVGVIFKVDNIVIESPPPISRISAGRSSLISANWTPLSEGVHTITVVVDNLNKIKEENENNNNASIILSLLPDLKFSGTMVFSSLSPREGDIVTITVTVENNGSVGVVNLFSVEFYDGNPPSESGVGGTMIGKKDLIGIDAGQTQMVSIQWTATVGSFFDHTIYAVLDPQDSIHEVNDGSNGIDNNEISATISIKQATGTSDEGSFDWLPFGIILIAIIILILVFVIPTKKTEDEEEGGEKELRPRKRRSPGTGTAQKGKKKKATKEAPITMELLPEKDEPMVFELLSSEQGKKKEGKKKKVEPRKVEVVKSYDPAEVSEHSDDDDTQEAEEEAVDVEVYEVEELE